MAAATVSATRLRLLFYFTAPSVSGPNTGPPPAGFYTQFWWSNPVNLQLLTGNQGPATISVDLGDPTQWSDRDGQTGGSQPEAYIEATQNSVNWPVVRRRLLL